LRNLFSVLHRENTMKSFVVLSYYQLSHAIALTLELGEKTNLYFSVNHMGVDDSLAEKINATGLFHKVVLMDHSAVKRSLDGELERTVDLSPEEIDQIGNSLFEKYLTPFYAKVFEDADFEDTIYVYNDFQLHYYYIASHFSDIVGIEDGYAILEKQMNLINNTGIQYFNHGKTKAAFVGKYWPEMQWKNPAVKTVISSVPLTDEAPAYLKEKVSVLNYYELVRRHKEAHSSAMNLIFDVDLSGMHPDASLVLTQALHRNKYCSGLENFLLHRKIIREELEKSDYVYVKPHPADRTDYSVLENERIIILEKNFPSEMLEREEISFHRVVSFMSAATERLQADEHAAVFDEISPERSHIVGCISQMTAGESVRFDYYVRVRKCTPEAYINVYLMRRKPKYIRTRINVLLDRNAGKADYFDFKYVQKRIEQYFEERKRLNKDILWEKPVRELAGTGEDTYAEMNVVPDADCSDAGAAELISSSDAEFFFLTDAENQGNVVQEDITSVFTKKSVKQIKAFPEYTYVGGQKYDLGTGVTGSAVDNRLSGRIYHRSFLEQFHGDFHAAFDSFRVIEIKPDCAAYYVRGSFYRNICDCSLLAEDREPLTALLAQCSSADSAACMIKAIQIWLTANNMPVSKLEAFLKDAALSDDFKVSALLSMSAEELKTRQFEAKRFIYQNEMKYRYARKDIDKMIDEGYFEKYRTHNEKIAKLKRFVRRK